MPRRKHGSARSRDHIIAWHVREARRRMDPTAAGRVVSGHAELGGNSPTTGSNVNDHDSDAVIREIGAELRNRDFSEPLVGTEFVHRLSKSEPVPYCGA